MLIHKYSDMIEHDLKKDQVTHSPAEVATAGAALVLHHAVPVVLAQNQQLNRVGGTHHFLFQDGVLAAGQLPVDALRGHTLPVC